MHPRQGNKRQARPGHRARLRPLVAGLAFGLAGLILSPAMADEGLPPLPQPLTLEAALNVPLDQQYRVMAGRADLDRALARSEDVRADFRPQVGLHGHLRYVRPNSAAENQRNADNAVEFSARQSLYDFGRRQARQDAADLAAEARRQALLDVEQRQRLTILNRYLEVLLADQAYTAINEEMAIYFVNLDKVRDRFELGMISSVELARQETAYQAVLLERAERDAQRRLARRQLAEALGRPDQLSSRLAAPALESLLDREPPALGEILDTVQARDPVLQVLKTDHEASRRQVDAARARDYPEIYARIDSGQYSRELGSRDHFRAGLYIDVPLYTGGKRNAAIGQAQADRMSLQAAIAEREARLREHALALYERILALRSAGRQAVAARDQFADLNFIRNQTLYEMEKATDLGDSMVEVSRARLQTMEIEFALALAWAELEMLRGGDFVAAVLGDDSAGKEEG